MADLAWVGLRRPLVQRFALDEIFGFGFEWIFLLSDFVRRLSSGPGLWAHPLSAAPHAVVVLVPFGMGPDVALLARIAPGMLWIGALWIAWRADPWGARAADDPTDRLVHDDSFHMHDPLHPGGKVSMVDQFHLELESRAAGEHRLWISNAFRQEIDPAGFEGSLTVEPVGLPASAAPFTRPGRGKELIAHWLKARLCRSKVARDRRRERRFEALNAPSERV